MFAAVLLHRIDPDRRMHRFYRLEIARDLFGDWLLIRAWGRIGSAGQSRTVSFPTEAVAEVALGRHRRRKERRGYAAT